MIGSDVETLTTTTPPSQPAPAVAAAAAAAAAPTPPDAGRVAVAVICNSLPPYRLHVQRRLAQEWPDVRLYTVLTHDQSNAPWRLEDAPPEIGLVRFGEGEKSDDQAKPARALHEWRKGGRITRWLAARDVRAVVLLGYNDAGRLRILRWCRRRGAACFVWGDSNIAGDNPTGVRRWVKRLLVPRVLRWTNAALACGRRGVAYFERYGVPRDRIFLFTLEPDYQLIRSIPPDAVERAAAKFGLPPGRRRIVFCGRMVNLKRPDLVLDAFAQLAAERPDWDLLMIGDGPLRPALQSRLPEGLRARAVWTGFIDDPATVGALYRASDVLVLPSDYEPWALVVNEAAAAGLAIVATDVVGAAPELVHEDVNGRTFPAGDAARLTAALRDVTDPGRIDAMKSASAHVLDRWRAEGDPVRELRRALESRAVLTARASNHAGA